MIPAWVGALTASCAWEAGPPSSFWGFWAVVSAPPPRFCLASPLPVVGLAFPVPGSSAPRRLSIVLSLQSFQGLLLLLVCSASSSVPCPRWSPYSFTVTLLRSRVRAEANIGKSNSASRCLSSRSSLGVFPDVTLLCRRGRRSFGIPCQLYHVAPLRTGVVDFFLSTCP